MEVRSENLWILVTETALEVGEVDQMLRDERAGGICTFLGTTRRFTGDSETVELRYDAYPEMAAEEMERLAREALERWPVVKLALHHRFGRVGPAEASVLVGAAAPHRAEAFEACRFLIDALKERVPFWKKEVLADGGHRWIEGKPGG